MTTSHLSGYMPCPLIELSPSRLPITLTEAELEAPLPTPKTATVPKLIHQIWLGGEMPADIEEMIVGMMGVNHDFRFQLWTEDNLDLLLPEWLYQHHQYAGSSNVIRLHALYKYGGIYMDCDFEAVRNMAPLCDIEAGYARQPDGVPCNAALIAAPGHPWIGWMIDNYGECERRGPDWGCHVIDRVPEEFKAGVVELPTDTFYVHGHGQPEAPPTQRTLAIHKWKASWV